MDKEKNNKSKIMAIIKKFFTIKRLGIVVICIFLMGISFIVGRGVTYDGKTTKIKFEDIGELATQAAYTTEIQVTDANRNILGIEIPFTNSKYIYSYDVMVKAGFDFENISYSDNGKVVTVDLPEPKVLTRELDLDSFKLYHEDESIFRQIKLTETNKALSELEERAEKDAIKNGLFDDAKANAEVIIKNFLSSSYDFNEYEIKFNYVK